MLKKVILSVLLCSSVMTYSLGGHTAATMFMNHQHRRATFCNIEENIRRMVHNCKQSTLNCLAKTRDGAVIVGTAVCVTALVFSPIIVSAAILARDFNR